ncbi:3716_t:CDS:2 [Diversispora eburnea]|uniref:3716_t:CDS:1 n=1 Tax=Diversispora eburnea TaxID=1213867 RepID=A0A9N8WNI8_9GLOM|nr:3716_t:CDS:2 [Diversispora eburnea]
MNAAIAAVKKSKEDYVRELNPNRFAIRDSIFKTSFSGLSKSLSSKKDIVDINSEQSIFKVGRTTGLTKGNNKEVPININTIKERALMDNGDSGCVWFNSDGSVIALGHGTLCVGEEYSVGSPISVVLNALSSPETPNLELYLKQD